MVNGSKFLQVKYFWHVAAKGAVVTNPHCLFRCGNWWRQRQGLGNECQEHPTDQANWQSQGLGWGDPQWAEMKQFTWRQSSTAAFSHIVSVLCLFAPSQNSRMSTWTWSLTFTSASPTPAGPHTELRAHWTAIHRDLIRIMVSCVAERTST